MVLMKVGKRICNSRCYLSKGKKCNCVCHGRYRRIGKLVAIEIATGYKQGSLYDLLEGKERYV